MKLYKSEPSQRRFACFHLLLFIADHLDIDTAVTLAQNVADEKPVDPIMIEMFN